MRNTLTKWHVEKEFYKADQIATLPTSMAVEQVSAGIDIERKGAYPCAADKALLTPAGRCDGRESSYAEADSPAAGNAV
jgi:hypothetical protein